MRISDWSSDVCSSDLAGLIHARLRSATRTRLPLLQQLHFDRTVARPLRGSALAVAPAMRQREIDRRAHRRHLRSVALLGRRAGTVAIDLGGCRVAPAGDARAQAEPADVVLDDARRHHGRTDASLTVRGAGTKSDRRSVTGGLHNN